MDICKCATSHVRSMLFNLIKRSSSLFSTFIPYGIRALIHKGKITYITKFGRMVTPSTPSTTETSSTSEQVSNAHSGGSSGYDLTTNHHFHITSHKLNGNNYLQWSQSVMLFIRGKGKEDYLIGAASSLEATDPNRKLGNAKNSLVMSWLLNSMTNEIGENFLLYETASDI